MLKLKRAYEPAARGDGYRVLVDRLWPRGVSKDKLAIDAWEKALAPSDGLRKWYGHDPKRFKEFARRYRDELKDKQAHALLESLHERAVHRNVTLVAGAKDMAHSNAAVLKVTLARMHSNSRGT